MNALLVVLTLAWPLSLAALKTAPAWRRVIRPWAAWAALPALVAAVLADGAMLDLPWVLIGSRLGVDATSRVFLGLTAALWLASGVFARSYLAHDAARDRYELFHLLTMAGNLGATIAQDMISFVTCFTLMSLAAYGLIVHDRTTDNLRAGRIYIVLVVLGEVFIFWALALAASEAGTHLFAGLADKVAASPQRGLIAGLVLAGFGIKLGIMPLHIWLPLAHPAAPTPASAVLSGAIIKTGLLAMLRLLPLGAAALPDWGAVCVAAGIVTAYAGALIGISQRHPKALLAYSSVSQMGLAAAALGAGLGAPEKWDSIRAGLLMFVVHHGIAKAALFLGVGIALPPRARTWQRGLLLAALSIPAFALAGLPLTTGMAAKAALKYASAAIPGDWAAIVAQLLTLTGVTTALLMARLLWLAGNRPQHHAATATMITTFSALAAGPVVMLAAMWGMGIGSPSWLNVGFDALWSAAWPLLFAGAAVFVVLLCGPLAGWLGKLSVPPGDLAVPLEWAVQRLRHGWDAWFIAGLISARCRLARLAMRLSPPALDHAAAPLAGWLENDLAAGLALGAVLAALLVLLLV